MSCSGVPGVTFVGIWQIFLLYVVNETSVVLGVSISRDGVGVRYADSVLLPMHGLDNDIFWVDHP